MDRKQMEVRCQGAGVDWKDWRPSCVRDLMYKLPSVRSACGTGDHLLGALGLAESSAETV